MDQKPLFMHVAFNEQQIDINKQLKNTEKMVTTAKINTLEENKIFVGLNPPDGMMWDHYGNPEFIEEE